MIEPEIAYADLADAMNCAEDYVRYCCRYLLDTCMCASLSSLICYLLRDAGCSAPLHVSVMPT